MILTIAIAIVVYICSILTPLRGLNLSLLKPQAIVAIASPTFARGLIVRWAQAATIFFYELYHVRSIAHNTGSGRVFWIYGFYLDIWAFSPLQESRSIERT